jgi:AcrR family transcriptional regulator
LELFNTNGLSQVTLRTIANKMGISQGNLNYHYKKRETIIESLYFQLVAEIDESMVQNEVQTLGLSSLLSISTLMMKSFYSYRFFLLDFVQIMRENDKIKNHYLELSQLRETQFLGVFHQLQENGVLRKEELPNEYLFLYKRFQILGDFWISSAEVTKSRWSKKVINEYSEIINQAIFPYLTDSGKQEFCKINNC